MKLQFLLENQHPARQFGKTSVGKEAIQGAFQYVCFISKLDAVKKKAKNEEKLKGKAKHFNTIARIKKKIKKLYNRLQLRNRVIEAFIDESEWDDQEAFVDAENFFLEEIKKNGSFPKRQCSEEVFCDVDNFFCWMNMKNT